MSPPTDQGHPTAPQSTESLLELRIKELKCLNDIGRQIDETPPIPALLAWVAERIPAAMQYPDDCLAAVEFDGQVYGTAEALELPRQMVEGMYSGDERAGQVTIAYTQDHDFLNEESALLGDIVRRINGYVENQRLLAQTRRRALRLQTAAEVSRTTGSILNPNKLIQQVVELARERFDLYYAGLFLVDQSDEWAMLHAGTGEAGRVQMEQGHKLEIGGDSMIGSCISSAQARIALDVGAEARRFDNPHLPKTRSEMALPLIARGHVIGAMTIQSEQEAAFSDQDITVLQTMADQVAIAIENARLLEQVQSRAGRERLVRSITDKVHRSADKEAIMRTTLQELSRVLKASKSVIRLGTQEQLCAEFDQGAPATREQ